MFGASGAVIGCEISLDYNSRNNSYVAHVSSTCMYIPFIPERAEWEMENTTSIYVLTLHARNPGFPYAAHKCISIVF
jgi:hypothetical protein